VSRRFVTGTSKALDELLARDLSGLDAAVLMVDGADFAGAMCVVALVVTADGTKVPVGLRLGDTENKTVVSALLADVVGRGLDYTNGLLVVIDGAKALATAVRKVFGELALIQRCQIHKRRTSRTICPSRNANGSTLGCAARSLTPTRSPGCARRSCWPPSSNGSGPTRPGRCAKASMTCSPSAASGSTGPSLGRWCAPT
jgi:Transposase, Mutator family